MSLSANKWEKLVEIPKIAPKMAAQTKPIPTYKMPLPKNMVAKKWSSRSPIRSRITPVNQRKAIPEKTTNKTTTEEVLDKVSSHSILNSVGSDTDDINTKLVIRISANRIPAIAAERGDLTWRRINGLLLSIMISSFLIIGIFQSMLLH